MFPRIPRRRAGRVALAMACHALLLLLVLSANRVASAANELLVPSGAVWRFLGTGEEAPVGWMLPGFDASLWSSGAAKIGIGQFDHATFLPAPMVTPRMSVYVLREFSLPANGAGYSALLARMVFDAGAVIYLNGAEAARVGMPGGIVTGTTAASAEPYFPEEGSVRAVPLDLSELRAGVNTLAVEVHASSSFDADLDFDLELIGCRNAAPAFVVRGPYLQNGATKAVTVRWRTDVPTATSVAAGLSVGNLNVLSTSPALTTEHEARLENLTPDTRYYYAIGDGVQWIEGPGTAWQFRTLPLAGTVKPVRVWVLGDGGRGRSGNGGAEAVRDSYLHSPLYRRPDVWLMLGDNAYYVGSDAEYQNAVFDTYRTTLRSSILWPTLGNHETYTPGTPYFSIFTLPANGEAGGLPSGTEHFYSFDFANIHFVCLDSMQSVRTPGSAMLSWLEADLASTTQRWIIAFWHHPPYTKGTHDSDAEIEHVEMRQYALPILEAYGVDLVLGGHSHVYERSCLLDGHYGYSWELDEASIKDGGSGRADEPDGLYGKDPGAHQGAVYCVAGSSGQAGGGPLNHPVMVVSTSELGSMILDVEGDQLDAKFLNSQGIIRDYFSISKAPLVTLSAPQPALAESGGAPGTVRLSRSQETSRDIPVQLSLAGTATAGSDYAMPPLPAVILAGQQTLDVPFSAFRDAVAEGTETITVTLLEGSEYRLPKSVRSVTLSLADLPIDAWRFENFGLQANDPLIAGNDADADRDGQSNFAEYLAGTGPRDATSRFAATPARDGNGRLVVRFLARKGRPYTVFYRQSFSSGAWQILASVAAPAANQVVEIPDPAGENSAQRFYKVTTPGPP